MSIRIDNMTRGRFGNKVLQYNSLMQLAISNNIKPSCKRWDEGTEFFKNITSYVPSNKKNQLLFYKKIIDNEEFDFGKYSYNIDDPAYCLHNVFYNVTKNDPRQFLEIKDELKPLLDPNIVYIGIHFRGGDIIKDDGNNGREIHSFEYYKNSIDFILSTLVENDKYLFIICTDDKSFKPFKKCKEYLDNNNIKYDFGIATKTSNHYIHDWIILSECNILINSSSTFCVTAGFLGKKNKYIIHSKEWIDKNKDQIPWNNTGDKDFIWGGTNLGIKIKDNWKYYNQFWVDLENKHKDNDYYYCNKFI